MGINSNDVMQVQGLGPIFRLTVTVQNTSPSTPVTGCFLTFGCDETLYRISRKLIPVGGALLPLSPPLSLSFSSCLS